MILENLKNMISRVWSKAPSKSANGLPALFHTNPRLDPVRVIAKAAASVEWKLYSKKAYRRDGDSAPGLESHDLYDILENPCPTFKEIDGWNLRYMTIAHVRLVGEFFWLKVRTPGGKIVALLPIPAAWVPKKPTVGSKYFIIYPYGVTASKALTVMPEDVVWFKDVDLNDPYGNGRGASEAITDEVETDEFASKYQKNFFFNDANPPYAILAPGANETAAKQIKESWMSKLAGWTHSKEPAVLNSKDASIVKLGNTMVEVDMIESRKFLRDQVLQHYQIPPEIYGIVENSNRATIDSAFYLFNKNVISYDLKFFERVVNAQLCPDFDDDTILLHDNIISEDEEFALKMYNAGLEKGAIKINEWRTRWRFPEVPGGDVFMPQKTQQSAPASAPATSSVSTPEEEEKYLEIVESKVLKIADESESRRIAIWKSFDVKALSIEPAFISAVKRISGAQLPKVKASIKAAVTADKTEDAIIKALGSQFGIDTDYAVKRTLAPAWMEGLKAGKLQARETLAGNKSIKADDDSIIGDWFNKWVEKYGLKKAKEINTTTYNALRKLLTSILSDSISEGDGLGVMIKKLMTACEGVYDNMSKSRAETIARTESVSSVNGGTYATYKVSGVERKEWLSIHDSRTRDDEFDHVDADGETVGIDEKFTKTGEDLDYPGDPVGAAGNIINCRCSMAPVISED